MGTLLRLTLLVDAEHFNQLGLFLNTWFFNGWKIAGIEFDHPQVTFTISCQRRWTSSEEKEFQELFNEHLLRKPHELLAVEVGEPRVYVRSPQTKQMIRDLLGALRGLVGEDGRIEGECTCHEGLAKNQTVCPICWATTMYTVYTWAQTHLL